jgi:hypothetical protein
VLISVPVSVGELIDKITILEIKKDLIADADKLKNINKELELLTQIRETLDLPTTVSIFELMLKDTNRHLWDIEDGKRACEARGEFGEDFVRLSRELYVNNDLRGEIKRKINDLVGSEIVEEKMYTKYNDHIKRI